ncbi:MAG TPA: hypothetical protein VGE21_09425 [Flavobacteriales bacterium]
MRPQDVAVLLKIAALGEKPWLAREVAAALHLSPAEVSNSLKRSALAGLIDTGKRKVAVQALLDFLQHGLAYVFPARPGGMVRGVPTAHSASPLRSKFMSEETYVWASAMGEERGHEIPPLYPGAVAASLNDPEFHALLALTDALRVGRTRERAEAAKELARRLK